MKYKDITGLKYGKLTVIKYKSKNKYWCSLWGCKYDCSKTCVVDNNVLKRRQKQSCGCLNHENHIYRPNRKTHGIYKIQLYRIWKKMKSRCYNQNDPDYKKGGDDL